MAKDHVLRLRRTDVKGEHLLVNVSQPGSRPLDLKLVASEGEHVYPAKIKESNVKSLQASNYSGNLDDWKAILKYALLQERTEGTTSDAFDGLETVAAIDGTTFTITLRKNVSGITQRLGSIKLEQDDDEEISLFDWAGTAVEAADDLRAQLETLQLSVVSQQEQVATLNRQLDDLVKAKKDHEDELLKKFAALLNEKKLKIRDQQRLLAGAKVNSEAGETVGDARNGGSRGKTAGSSRRGKRKANGVAEPSPDDVLSDEDTAAEDEDDAAGTRQEETPQDSDRDATEDEESDADGFEAAPVPSQASGRGVRSKGKAFEAARTKANGGDAKEVEDPGEAPARRALPFSKKDTGKAAEAKRPEPVRPLDDDDDDETDDEL
ncbi:hypothetical protein LTR36_000046 [Oleoguttula mirabilis]|uniref:XRCC4 coiled-coil domain-containing protein n=1 Tax=Oleoguttula mirabilis TaxID=1507867 RepID=A0AAV9JXP9_9PEZI|nr:hypothetical protein LTR36_000046 [Oleoguttula mirabilis]